MAKKKATSVEIMSEYRRIMIEEFKLVKRFPPLIEKDNPGIIAATDISNVTHRLSQIAESSFVPRSYVSAYGINHDEVTNESVGAHTNLVIALTEEALSYYYGSDFGNPEGKYTRTIDGYTAREVTEAARQHDLAENVFGDIPDNGDRDNAAKDREEDDYFYRYSRTFPKDRTKFTDNVFSLLMQMRNPYSPTGRLLYLADKTAALFITLQYDTNNISPQMDKNNPDATGRDKTEMELCDYVEQGKCKASEMWAIDYFKMREICKQDDYGFFTAILVMRTLEVNGKWYSWREADYNN